MKTKMDKSFSIILAIIITSIVFVGCKKDRASFQGMRSGSGSLSYAIAPSGCEPIYVENKLKWLARSLPILAHTVPDFANTVQNSINSSLEKKRSNAELETALNAFPSPAYNYNNGIYDTINSRFPGNDYDSSYFYAFEFEDCLQTTNVHFLENQAFTLSDNKTLVVVAFFESVADTLTGYFYDTIAGGIDSLLIYEENADNYDVWVVDADNQCLDGPGGNGPIFSFNPEGHCGDGECQPFLGETPTNCSDCIGKKQSGNFTLILKQIQHTYDKHYHAGMTPAPNDKQQNGYHESYFSGKYDIYFAYSILTVSDGLSVPYIKDAWYIQNITKRAFARDWYEDNNGYDTKKFTDLILKRLKKSKDDVVREKNDGGTGVVHSSSNTPNIITIDKVLSYNFVPNTDRIYTEMLEWDRSINSHEEEFQYSDGIFVLNKTIKYRQHDHTDPSGVNYQHCPYYFGYVPVVSTFSPLNPGIWQDGSSLYGSGSFYLDIEDNNDRTKFEDRLIGSNSTLDLINSEMTIRYVLLPNP